MKRLLLFCLYFTVCAGYSQKEFPLESILQKGHSKYITAADIHPSGNYAVTAGYDNAVFLWNLKSGKTIRQFNRHTEAVWSAVFNQKGDHLLTASADNTARVFDIVSGKQIHKITIPEPDLRTAYYSLNGEHIILISSTNLFYIYDVQTAELIGEFKKSYSVSHLENVIDPTGNKVIASSGYEGATVFDLNTNDTLFFIPFDKVFGMGFSPDGKYIALSSSKQFSKVFDAVNGQEIAHLKDPDLESECNGCHTHMTWSNNSKYLLTMSNKADAILWNASNGKKLQIYADIRERPTELKFSPDDNYVVISLNEDVMAYNRKSGNQTLAIKSDYIDYFNINLSEDSKYIILPGDQETGVIWDIRSGRKHDVLKGFLNQEKYDGLGYIHDNWFDKGILRFVNRSRGFSVSPDGSLLAIGNVDSVALILDLSTGKVKHTLKGHSKAVLTTTFSPDGKTIATAGGDRIIKLWDVKSGKHLQDLKGHRAMIFDLKFNSDGSQLVSGSWDGSLILWDLENKKNKYVDLNGSSPYVVGFTPNDLYVISSNTRDAQFEYRESDALKTFRNLIGHTDIVSDFDFNPGGDKMVSSSWDGKVKIWDVLTGMQVARFNGHEGGVFATAWDPQNRFIASAGADNVIYLFNPANGKLLHELKGHINPITSLSFLPSGQKLISSSEEGMVKIWDLNNLKEVFSRIQISRDEWLITTPSGHFDGSPKALTLVNYVSGLEVVPVGSLFDKYFTPNLIKRANEGENFNDTGENIHQTLEQKPLVAFHLNESNKRSIETHEDSIYKWKQDVISLELEINSNDQPIEEIRVYNNGKLVLIENIDKEIVFRGGKRGRRTVKIPLVDGENEIKAIAVNKSRTESEPSRVVVSFDGEAAKTDLYIVSVGINDYKNPKYNLDYAVNDAKAFAKSVKMGGDTLFNEVFITHIKNDEATKKVIEQKFNQIAKQIGPEDVFLFYYAGHGVMSQGSDDKSSEFYIVTYDVTNLYAEQEALSEKALSAKELMQYSANISAAKQLFILDACHSGGALTSIAQRGGDGREKALAQLARSTGTFFLTASQDAQYANEVGNLKHGLFTYALLEIIEGETGDNGDQKVTVNEIKTYVEERVPELSEKYHGSPQYPTSYSFGQDFPIVILR